MRLVLLEFCQILAGLINLAYGSQKSSRPKVASKSYAAVFMGAHLVELHLQSDLHAIRLDFHVANAVALLQQVCVLCALSSTAVV